MSALKYIFSPLKDKVRNLTRTPDKQKRGKHYPNTGEEKFVKCCCAAFRGQIYFQYDYRHTDGELFSTVAKTLDECRRRRDGWIEKKERSNK